MAERPAPPPKVRRIFGPLLLAAGAALLLLGLAGFDAIKPLADNLARDGDLERYTPGLHAGLAWLWRVLGLALALGGYALRRGWLPHPPDWRAQLAALLDPLRPAVGDRLAAFTVLALTLLGAWGRGLLLWQGMGHDEAYTYVAFAGRSLLAVLSDYHLPNNHILHSLLVFISTRLLGAAPWAVRLPAYLAGVALIPLAYLAGRALYNRGAGLLAAALTAALPVLVDFSVDARGYTLMAVFSLLAVLAAEAQRRQPTGLGWLALGLCFGLGLYTLPIMLLPMALIGGWLGAAWLAGETGGGRRPGFLLGLAFSAALGLGLMFVLYSPVYLLGTGLDSVYFNRFVRPLPPEEWGQTLALRFGQTRALWALGRPWLEAALLGGLALSLALHRQSAAATRWPHHLVGLAAMLILMWGRGLAPLPRNWVFLAPFVMLWVGAGWAALAGWLLALVRRSAWFLPLAAALALLIAAAGLGHAQATARTRLAQPSLEERLALYLLAEAPGEGRALTTSPLRAPILYYLGLHSGGNAAATLYTEGDPVDYVLVVIGRNNETLASDAAKHGWAQWLDLAAAELIHTTGPGEVWHVPTRAP